MNVYLIKKTTNEIKQRYITHLLLLRERLKRRRAYKKSPLFLDRVNVSVHTFLPFVYQG